jgi:streptomycin 6-kinase
VRLGDGSSAVAKVPPAGHDSAEEGAALRAWAGDGAVALLAEHDGVLLLERAVPGAPTDDGATVAACLRRLWVAPPAAVAWRRADDLCGRWAATVERWRSTIGDRLTDAAVAAWHAGLGPGERVLLHGDGHHGNVLDGGPARGWLAIDPQPLVGPPALDLVPALFNGPEAPVRDRIRVLAGAAGVEPAAVEAVAVARCVLSAAWSLDDGADPARALRVAAELA